MILLDWSSFWSFYSTQPPGIQGTALPGSRFARASHALFRRGTVWSTMTALIFIISSSPLRQQGLFYMKVTFSIYFSAFEPSVSQFFSVVLHWFYILSGSCLLRQLFHRFADSVCRKQEHPAAGVYFYMASNVAQLKILHSCSLLYGFQCVLSRFPWMYYRI